MGTQRGRGPKFRSFFPSPALHFHFPSLGSSRVFFFLSLGVFSLSFCGVFGRPGPLNVRVFALGLSCGTPAAFGEKKSKILGGPAEGCLAEERSGGGGPTEGSPAEGARRTHTRTKHTTHAHTTHNTHTTHPHQTQRTHLKKKVGLSRTWPKSNIAPLFEQQFIQDKTTSEFTICEESSLEQCETVIQ